MRARLTLFASLLLLSPAAGAQPTPTPVGAQPRPTIEKLPLELRAPAERAVTGQLPEAERVASLRQVAGGDRATVLPVLLWVMERDPSADVRLAALKMVSARRDASTWTALAKAAAQDPDARVAIAATERLQNLRAHEAAEVLAKRVVQAQEAGDLASARALAAEQDRWVVRRNGGSLPAFLRQPPPLFTVKPAGRRVRVLAFGDYGNGSPGQLQVAAAMRTFHRKERFDFGLTAGDNFYSVGLPTPDDLRWKTQYEDLYSPLRVPIYATLGNHDWGHPDSPIAQIMYSGRSKTWRLPAPYYTYTAGAAQFFALDTDKMSEAQLMWLDEQLSASRARWKIVYGHHPIFSYGKHGDTETLLTRLLPLLEGRADLYVCGHEHDLQHLQTERGLHLVVTGGGGANLRTVESGPRTLWAKSSHGFTVFDIDDQRLRIRFVDQTGKVLHDHATDGRVAKAN